MMSHDYDLFVIGAGSGGVRAARIAAQHGARVAIAEEYRIGGTCVIRGCVPKKLMVYASRFADEFADAAGFGWTVGETRFDWATLIANKDREIARLEGIYRSNLAKAGVVILESRAVVAGPHAVELVATGERITAGTILVATGGRAEVDERLPGVEHVVTSNEMFHLEHQPRRLVVAGGGYIAVEFASLMAGLGTETTLVYRGEEILRGFDREVRRHVHAELERRGVRIVCGDIFSRIEKTADGLDVTLRSGGRLVADTVMMAIGRRPNTAGLGLEAAGVALDAKGAVVVDAQSRSSVPSIYAVGDVTDRFNLTPVAIREGHAFADTVFGGRPVTVDHQLVPTAVFTTPEVGTVGLTEDAVIETGRAYDVYRATFRPMRATLSGREERMLMKLLVDGETDRVLGCHIVGPDAGEMVQLIGIALKMGATKADFDATMAVHPTAAEELVTMRVPSERHPARIPAAGG
ncbi:glutathione-disulfide reductase [Prosthecodimorpha staleyi]|uniref:Glutathione reductase n=1 Tax=Prosthecodimorpha staleyi TaxID=2840188 RepID=A0A947DCQ4_9HYPH|nr:glutathione-disulfide reductase [Prosthecodimorpha staleyi]MBT9292529.1 glutathione-disulfide reductase [Prosthecodimorpha staleyi]